MGRPQIIAFDDLPKGQEVVIKIPADATFSDFAIMATVDDPELIVEGIELFMNAGDEKGPAPTRLNFQWQGLPAWNDGKGIILKNPDVKAGDVIKLLLITKGRVNVLLEAYISSNGIRNISMYTSVRDTVPRQSDHYYRLNLADFKTYIKSYSLSVKLTKFTGFPRLMISSDQSFGELTSMIAVGTLSNQKFLLSPEKRSALNITDVVFIKIDSQE